jgi:hypothetical protein
VYLLDSGLGYSVGDSGTILKSTDAGMTWNALTSGTTKALYDVYFFNDAEGVAVGRRRVDSAARRMAARIGRRSRVGCAMVFARSPLATPTGSEAGFPRTSFTRVTPARAGMSRKEGFFGGGFFGAQMLSPTLGVIDRTKLDLPGSSGNNLWMAE